MVQLRPGYVVNERGTPEAVVLSLPVYRRLIAHLEDLEDAMDLKRAVRTSHGTMSHEALLKRLAR